MTNAELSPRFELIPRSGARRLLRVTGRRQDTACADTHALITAIISIGPFHDMSNFGIYIFHDQIINVHGFIYPGDIIANKSLYASLTNSVKFIRNFCPLLRTQLIN